MQAMIWVGALLTLAGVAGLLWCVVQATRAKRAGLDAGAMRARMQGVVAMNLAALGVSTLGLMAVILGIFLG